MELAYMRDAALTARSLSDDKVSVTLALDAEGIRASARLAGTRLETHRVVPYDAVRVVRRVVLAKATVDTVLVALLGAAAVIGLVWMWASTPVVYESHSTGECVRVLSPDPEDSCERLPDRYEHVWVE